MRGLIGGVAAVLCGCGSSAHTTPADGSAPAADADVTDAGTAPPDALPDAPACEQRLLVGGTDPLTHGWTAIMMQPATLTNGPDYVALHTSTTAGQNSGGQLLLRYPGAIDPALPIRIEFVMLVEQAAAHNPFDASIAIMPSCTGSAGTQDERGQMLYLQPGRIGWADDTDEFTTPVADGAYHSYVISLDAAGTEQVAVDGHSALTRVNVLRDGAITVGDQSNDKGLDSTLRIRSITRLCN